MFNKIQKYLWPVFWFIVVVAEQPTDQLAWPEYQGTFPLFLFLSVFNSEANVEFEPKLDAFEIEYQLCVYMSPTN